VAQLVFFPSGARMRESLSYDLPLCGRSISRARSGASSSRRARIGCATSNGSGRALSSADAAVPGRHAARAARRRGQLQLYDFNPGARRTYSRARCADGEGRRVAARGMFQERFDPSKGVLVSEPPPQAAGTPGPGSRRMPRSSRTG
jgi:hypothetical protein